MFQEISLFVTIYFIAFVLTLIVGIARESVEYYYSRGKIPNTIRTILLVLYVISMILLYPFMALTAPLIKLMELYLECLSGYKTIGGFLNGTQQAVYITKIQKSKSIIRKIIVAGISVICLALLVTCFHLAKTNRNLKYDNEQLSVAVSSAKEENQKLNNENIELNGELQSYKDKYDSIPMCYEKARVADRFIVYTTPYGKKYHKLECSYIDLKTCSVWWRDGAVARGFLPCSLCFGG